MVDTSLCILVECYTVTAIFLNYKCWTVNTSVLYRILDAILYKMLLYCKDASIFYRMLDSTVDASIVYRMLNG